MKGFFFEADYSNDRWVATLAGSETGDPIGYGSTKEEAVQDLKDRMAEIVATENPPVRS